MKIPNRKQGFSVICGFKFRDLWILIPWFMDYERKQQIQLIQQIQPQIVYQRQYRQNNNAKTPWH